VQRHREIASSPERTAGETWQVITELITCTLERSSTISREAVEATMARAGGVGRMLIAGGHLEADPIVVVAGDLWLEIATVSGDAALTLEENLNPVPGGASAEDWTVHLPADGPLAKFVKDVAKSDPHLSSDEPSAATRSALRETESVLSAAALTQWAKEQP
jgi:hypothetical protein